MKFVLEIEVGNDGMINTNQVAGAIRDVAGRVSREVPYKPKPCEHNIKDENGNRVGWWAFAEGWSVQKDPER